MPTENEMTDWTKPVDIKLERKVYKVIGEGKDTGYPERLKHEGLSLGDTLTIQPDGKVTLVCRRLTLHLEAAQRAMLAKERWEDYSQLSGYLMKAGPNPVTAHINTPDKTASYELILTSGRVSENGDIITATIDVRTGAAGGTEVTQAGTLVELQLM
ncbi:hypothetical protein [Pseudomonas sp. NPDC090592]|uniref:hypothetical protein n=1 Tax=Pseudomonas sp. NPDC090592 TaxID=3364480 RepID=UPI00383B92FC